MNSFSVATRESGAAWEVCCEKTPNMMDGLVMTGLVMTGSVMTSSYPFGMVSSFFSCMRTNRDVRFALALRLGDL